MTTWLSDLEIANMLSYEQRARVNVALSEGRRQSEGDLGAHLCNMRPIKGTSLLEVRGRDLSAAWNQSHRLEWQA